MFEHIEIERIYKKKIKEIEYDEFITLLSKYAFSIYLDYYSPFADSLLIRGSLGKYSIDFVVTEVAELTYTFEE